MMLKVTLFAALAIVASASPKPGLLAPFGVPLGAPLGAPFGAPLAYSAAPGLVRGAPLAPIAPVLARAEPVDAFPQYSFGYNVNDALTGDSKTQEETREGDVVRGSYSLIEADGSRRIVNYYADPITGFNAVVTKDAPVLAARAVVPAPLTARTLVL